MDLKAYRVAQLMSLTLQGMEPLFSGHPGCCLHVVQSEQHICFINKWLKNISFSAIKESPRSLQRDYSVICPLSMATGRVSNVYTSRCKFLHEGNNVLFGVKNLVFIIDFKLYCTFRPYFWPCRGRILYLLKTIYHLNSEMLILKH